MSRRVARAAGACALTVAMAAAALADVPPLPVLGDGTTIRVSTRADGSQLSEHATLDQVSVSGNGRYVVFYTTAGLGVGQCGAGVYLRDLVTMRLEMVSVPAAGCIRVPRGAGSASYTSVSADGRYVAFTSTARDLLPGRLLPGRSPAGNTTSQVFLRDRLGKRTTLVSVGHDGRPANASATSPTVSDDGRFVAFESSATNLVRGDAGDPDDPRTDVWIRDLRRGTTERVGPNIGRRSSKLFPSLSGNGRYVAFDAIDGTLAPSRGTGSMVGSNVPGNQVYVWDRVTKRTELVSRNDAGYAADGLSTLDGYTGSKISRDGRWVVYRSDALNLTGPNGTILLRDTHQVYMYDRVAKKVRRVTDGAAGEGGNGESDHPCISADGRFVSFASAASNLGDVDVTPGYYEGLPDVGTDIYLWERDTERTRLVSRSTEGMPADANSRESCPANRGKVVVFTSEATNLVDDDTNGFSDVFLRRYDG